MKLHRGIEVLKAMVKAFLLTMIKKFSASLPILTIAKSEGCDIDQEPNYGFFNM
jgi:hypothetical protein